MGRDEQEDRIQRRRLPGGGPAADEHALPVLDGEPQVGDHLRGYRIEADQVERGEGVLPEPPDCERGAALRHVHAEGGLETRTVRDRGVEHGLGDGDVLPGPLGQPDDEGVQLLCRVELQVRRDGSVLAVIDVQGHPDAVARDVFDLDIRHHHVDGPVSNEVPEHEVHDPFLRDGVEFDAELAEDAIDHAPKVVLLLGPLRAFEKLQVADEDLLEDVEELRFLFDELRLDRLVEVLVRHRVVQDPDVRVVLQDRLDFNLVHVLLDDLRDRRDLPEGRLHDAADLRGLPRVEDAGKDTVPEAVHDNGDEERDLDVVDDRRQVVGEGARTGERATRSGFQGAARLQHLRKESHIEDPDRHQEHHERDVDDRDVRGHRDAPLVLRELVLLGVVADHRQHIGHIAARIGRLHDDRDDPLDHRGLHAGRKESKRLRRGNAPRDLSRHLLDLGRELAVPAAARDHDRVREGHAETPRLRDVAKEVWESSLDLLDLALLLGQEEAVGTDESHDRKHEPEEEPFDRLLAWPEGEVHRTDQVQ